ncbi:MAG: zinc metalloprotease [Flavobacteriaceae bacterium]|nr:MAG: zinc metalloprotease [Flavobacteriaceae bacterium]
MKKVILGMAAMAFLFVGCNSDQNETFDEQSKIDMSDFYVYTDADIDEAGRAVDAKSCYSMVNLNRLLKENKGLDKKMYDIEYHTRSLIAAKPDNGNDGGNGGGNGGGPGGGGGGEDPTPVSGVINIPVYVHVIYSNSNQNISSGQINSQMDVLNDDFRRTNSDANQTPSAFSGVAADTEINFTLAGTFRHADSRTSWGTNDDMKAAYPPVTPETHLNIWVCNIGGGILGYAQFPGGPLATDGIVVSPQYFGTTGYVASPFDGGRTATHEVGHYLNLRHIWGDGRCNRDDFVSDTPTSDRPNYGCPGYPTTHCRSTDMTMNYMDYTDDACMNMYSEGQKERMRAIFASGGPRDTMVN